MPGMVDLSFFCSSGVRPVSSAEKKASAPSSSARPMIALIWRTLAMLSTRSSAEACCGVRQASRMTSGRWEMTRMLLRFFTAARPSRMASSGMSKPLRQSASASSTAMAAFPAA